MVALRAASKVSYSAGQRVEGLVVLMDDWTDVDLVVLMVVEMVEMKVVTMASK